MSSLDTWLAGIGAGATIIGLGYTAIQVHKIAKDVRRRADFQVEVGLELPPPVRVETHHGHDVFVVTRRRGSQLDGVLRIGFKNTGARRAEQTLLNVNGPTYLQEFYFSDQQGGKTGSATATTTGNLTDLSGSATRAWFLARVFDVIARRHSYVSYVHFRANDPLPQSIPFLVILDSDDLSDKLPNGVEVHVWVKIEYEREQA